MKKDHCLWIDKRELPRERHCTVSILRECFYIAAAYRCLLPGPGFFMSRWFVG